MVMGTDQIHKLTDSQRAYLRLVHAHKSSKEIAQQLGISAHTVDKRIKEAMRILAVRSRVEAARILADSERNQSAQLGPQSPDLAFPPARPSLALIDGNGAHDGVGATYSIGEEALPYRTYPDGGGLPLPIPTRGRPDNRLSTLQRLGWTIGLIIGLAIATGLLLSGITAFGNLMLSLKH